jgi:hypothetical protein
MADRDRKVPAAQTSAHEVEEFLRKVATTPAPVRAGGRGRLIFAIDATASREPTWDMACHIQGEMFRETDALGGLDVQLVFYRGFGQCLATPWVSKSADLVARMSRVLCQGGRTQIRKVLRHAVKETKKKAVHALVFVGDAMEEDVDALCHHAGELGLLGVPVFIFHEGGELIARRAFQQIARLSGGAYCSFDTGSAKQLRDLLSAVAVYAAGGRPALEDFGKRRGGAVLQITNQMR